MRLLAVACGLLAVHVLVSACAPKRNVYIPNEWRSSTPQTPSPAAPAREPRAPAGGSEQPILQPLPQIQEKDLSRATDNSKGALDNRGGSDAVVVPKAAGQASSVGPQFHASMHLVSTANAALDRGNADQAIAQLEQAIQVDAYNAEAFYQLARAWQSKGDTKRALEFARKSEILFQDQPQDLKKVYVLEADLLKRSGQTSEAEIYRQKATRLEF